MEQDIQTSLLLYQAKMEAVLFACAQPVSIADLADMLKIDRAACRQQLEELQRQYLKKERGVQLLFLEDKVQLCTKEEFSGDIEAILIKKKQSPLSDVSMEVLSIIAYNQPVTRGFVEQVRGVNSNQIVSSLVEKGLIEEAGRLNAPGKPILYRTTDSFLRAFSLSSIEELPPIQSDDLQQKKRHAEKTL